MCHVVLVQQGLVFTPGPNQSSFQVCDILSTLDVITLGIGEMENMPSDYEENVF